jgi:hypothetical protein
MTLPLENTAGDQHLFGPSFAKLNFHIKLSNMDELLVNEFADMYIFIYIDFFSIHKIALPLKFGRTQIAKVQQDVAKMTLPLENTAGDQHLFWTVASLHSPNSTCI